MLPGHVKYVRDKPLSAKLLALQNRASPVIEQLIYFHDHALIIILTIITRVFYTIIRIIQNTQTRPFILEGQIIATV